MEEDRSALPVFILPALHLIMCIAVEVTISDNAGGWKWFRVGMVDAPFFIVIEQIARFLPHFFAYSIFGTLWWYCISVSFRFLYRYATR